MNEMNKFKRIVNPLTLLNHMYLLITLIKVIFIFVTIEMILFISDILFLCLTFPKYNLSICIVYFKKVLDSTISVYKCLVTCDLLRVTEHHCCKGDWQQDSASCWICLLYRLCLDLNINSLHEKSIYVMLSQIFTHRIEF